ncbi:histidine phosphatase family protein [Niallia sp. XMNu-256]|uniref:histidine phosphatase family protein n=1 Tax=Niallia sp. XMNu-256 TaxID=3082444 RepID=UPI0030CE56D1
MQITFIRHLPTEWNAKTWLQGRQDIDIIPVNKEVQRKINNNKQQLEKLAPFELILASTLKRTHQTAEQYGLEVLTEPLLDELNFGPYEGRPKAELINDKGEDWLEHPKDLILGESLVHFENRILKFLEKYKDSHQILVFGHGSWIRACISIVQDGNINGMNQLVVENNECITLNIDTHAIL